MNQLEQTKIALMREASKTLNTISKVKNNGEDFVKCKQSYAHPEAIRTLYLQALESLIAEGLTDLVLTNEYLDLFELKQTSQVSTLDAAKESLLKQLRQDGRIYKIHSPQGEFVQCRKFAPGGADRPDENEEESRIMFLKALSELMRYGKVDLVSDSKEMSVFAPAMQYQSAAMTATEIYEDLRQVS